jgi:5'-nucleotidase (lipoprotein e(P4) family)
MMKQAAHLATASFVAVAFPFAVAAQQVPQNDLLNATLWALNSVEYQAVTISMFKLAKIRLDEGLADNSWSALDQTDAVDKPVAIIADVDETLFDNGGYQAWLIKAGTSYSGKTYTEWTKAREAKAVPGAVDFLGYADSRGVKVFYVTNRSAPQEADTRANAEALGFPMGGNVDTFLLKDEKEDWGSAKGTRLDFVAKDYRVLLLLGDNYGDFTDDAGGSEAERAASLERNMAHIGHDWIFFPNPQYGSFESAAFGGDWSKSPDERRQLKMDALPAWSGPTAQ